MSIQLPQVRRAPRQRMAMLLVIVGLAIASFHGSAEASEPVVGGVSAGAYHTCRIRSDSTLGCWGYNGAGQADPPAGTFTAVSAGTNDYASNPYLGSTHACGLRSDGTLACWGENNFGQSSPPTGVFIAVSAGWLHTCGVRSDGTLACWGNSNGDAPAGAFIAVSAGRQDTCALHSDGTLACWGYDYYGLNPPPAGTFSAVSSGAMHACGLRSDGTLACWGYSNSFSPQGNSPTGTFSAISAGGYHTCGLRSDGTLVCWDQWGQWNGPAGQFTAVSAGYAHDCGVRTDGTLACWGSNNFGQAPQPGLLPLTLPDGIINAAYNQAFSLVDAAPSNYYPYTPPTPGFALTAGALPSGLSLTAAGMLSGTPTTAGNFSFTVEGEDANGFVAQRSYTVGIAGPPDTTPPVIVATVSGTLGDNAWYTGNVTISWSVGDAESAITASSGCGTSTLTTDALGAGYTCTATSAGGTNSGSVTVKRDATAPVLVPAVTPSVILLNGSGTAAANASDALSGVATQNCTALVTSSVGSRSSTCTATDYAGNTAATAAPYSVIYGFVGFTTPVDNAPTVNVANAGQAVPFKWKLVDASGTPVINLASVTISAFAMSCSSGAVADAVEQYAAGASALQNLGGGYYQYNWKSPKTYQSSCKQLVLDLGDGSTRLALFHFK
jgi:alpha-tubulin suppressor-like RCC1 family protein